MDSVVGLDRTRALQRKDAFGSLPQAIATILSARGQVHVVTSPAVAPGVASTEDGFVASCRGPWTAQRLCNLVDYDSSDRFATARECPQHPQGLLVKGYDIRVYGPVTLANASLLVAPPFARAGNRW